MNLDEIREQWETDCSIDDLNPDRSSAVSPNLHAKYLGALMTYKLKLTTNHFEMSQLRAKKAKYFRGEMTREELEENGWEQWQYKTLKSEIESLMDADVDIQTVTARVDYLKTVIYYLESVLGEIRTRSFHVKNIIEWQKFRAGN
jgi:hypothetical protein